MLKNRFFTNVEVIWRLQAARDSRIVSELTIRVRMEEHDLRVRRPARKPKLEKQSRVPRLRFARENVN